MGIALLAASTLAHPLNALHRWWSRQRPAPGPRAAPAAVPFAAPSTWTSPGAAPRPAPGMPSAHGRTMAGTACTIRPPEPTRRPTRATTSVGGPPRMLRSHRSACGRMVISGRMADVCAELERLAASELRH